MRFGATASTRCEDTLRRPTWAPTPGTSPALGRRSSPQGDTGAGGGARRAHQPAYRRPSSTRSTQRSAATPRSGCGCAPVAMLARTSQVVVVAHLPQVPPRSPTGTWSCTSKRRTGHHIPHLQVVRRRGPGAGELCRMLAPHGGVRDRPGARRGREPLPPTTREVDTTAVSARRDLAPGSTAVKRPWHHGRRGETLRDTPQRTELPGPSGEARRRRAGFLARPRWDTATSPMVHRTDLRTRPPRVARS